MTISSSLNAGVAGLAANAARLATISDNIANSSTYGYKRAVADFTSMVIDSGGGGYSAGGVRVTTQRLIDERGPLVSSNNSTDLAVRGRGFLPVTSEVSIGLANADYPLYMATTGSFRTDAEGYLVSQNGLALLGWPALAGVGRRVGSGLSARYEVRSGAGADQREPICRRADDTMSLGVNLPATDVAGCEPARHRDRGRGQWNAAGPVDRIF